MTYSSGGLIQAADYNTFQTNFDAIWGTGSGDSGWGQPALTSVSNSGTTGVIASVTIANTAGVLTVTAGSYFIGQQIQISGTLTAGTINGTNNYTTPSIFYIITVASSTSITISLTPSGAAVASTAGTATPGGTFNVLSAQSLVTASQWASLVNNLSAAGSQTGTTLTARTVPVAGAAISVLPNVATDITSVTTRRGYSTGTATTTPTWTGSISKTTSTGSGSGAWITSWDQTVTFPSADQARYFWNAGGLVRLRMSKTSTGLTKDVTWNNFVATVGDFYISGRVNNADQVIAGVTYTGFTRIGGSGTPSTLATTTGWYQLTAFNTTLFTLFNSVDPESYIAVYARATSSTTLLLQTAWFQGDGADTAISGGTNTSSPFTAFGTAPAVLCNVITPSPFSGPLVNTWGTPTVASSLPSLGFIGPANFNVESINNFGVASSFTINPNGSIVLEGGNFISEGPTQWLDPLGSDVGSSYEARLVNYIAERTGGSNGLVLGTPITTFDTLITTAWVNMASPVITSVQAGLDDYIRLTFTLEIRRISTGETISRSGVIESTLSG